jgi:hypothetical protein
MAHVPTALFAYGQEQWEERLGKSSPTMNVELKPSVMSSA